MALASGGARRMEKSTDGKVLVRIWKSLKTWDRSQERDHSHEWSSASRVCQYSHSPWKWQAIGTGFVADPTRDALYRSHKLSYFLSDTGSQCSESWDLDRSRGYYRSCDGKHQAEWSRSMSRCWWSNDHTGSSHQCWHSISPSLWWWSPPGVISEVRLNKSDWVTNFSFPWTEGIVSQPEKKLESKAKSVVH